MDINRFWTLIDAARQAGGTNPDARVEALADALGPLPAAELQSFQNQYDARLREAYRWDLWGAAYVIGGGCSDDGFRYFRDWLISEGRAVFEAALANPESLADLPPIDDAGNELFGYVAVEMFEQAGGADTGMERDFSTEMVEPAGKPWEEGELDALYPRLSRLYG